MMGKSGWRDLDEVRKIKASAEFFLKEFMVQRYFKEV